MTDARTRSDAPDYGLDAPGVVRNLAIAAAAGFLVWLTAALRLWSGVLRIGPIAGVELRFPADAALWPAAGCAAMATWMVWTSNFGKIRERERLLDRIAWSGSERVLDVGCGRGLMLIGAAKRLSTGTATGIDIWQSEDLSGNRPDAVLDNARREAVADRVDARTADMRKIPFPDGTFDVVVSSAAIHNIYSAEGRALIDDIRHTSEYASAFAAGGCRDVRRLGSRPAAAFLALVTMGSLRPGTLLVPKPA